MTRRVVITGIGLVTPIGHSVDTVCDAILEDRHGVQTVRKWDSVGDLFTRLAGVVDQEFKGRWPRKKSRTMGRVARLAAAASDSAIEDSGLGAELFSDPRVGLAYGSTHGSSQELENFCRKVFGQDGFEGLNSSAFLRFMSHTTTANLALLYGIRGRVITTCSACVSASQAVGAGYEAIAMGAQDIMICGGAEELHWVPAGVFDIFQATSVKYNEHPERSPRPFDKDRDGVVIGEGAGTLILEERERAIARGAPIYGEVLGYGTNCDGFHLTAPSQAGMADAMRLALTDAKLQPSQIDYINAHGTGTLIGDVVESHATHQVFGGRTPISSTKGFMGHTLGACGTIEIALTLGLARRSLMPPTRNLEALDPECAPLDYVKGEAREAQLDIVMSNNFAFGGINTSLIMRAL